MSKRHQASRRRSYGRRQHELHERDDRVPDGLTWLDEPELAAPVDRWEPGRPGASGAAWLRLQAAGLAGAD